MGKQSEEQRIKVKFWSGKSHHKRCTSLHNYGSWLPARDWWIEQLYIYISRTFSQLGRTFSISNCFWAMVLSKGQPCSYLPMMCVSVLVSKHIFAKHAEMPATKSPSTMDKSCQSWVARCWPAIVAIVVQALQIAIDPTVQWKAIQIAPVANAGYLGIM